MWNSHARMNPLDAFIDGCCFLKPSCSSTEEIDLSSGIKAFFADRESRLSPATEYCSIRAGPMSPRWFIIWNQVSNICSDPEADALESPIYARMVAKDGSDIIDLRDP
ncbi:hypothetical protein LPJ57_003452 [Coemansia sp. RSA 486]|nr:hypothetical protein LPJ57_003452 [Coemansia sp. RSA 486]